MKPAKLKSLTHIRLSRRTKKILYKIGKKGESFDQIVFRVIKERRQVRSLWPYITGFFDAEGTIPLSIEKTEAGSFYISPSLNIPQKYIAGLYDGEGCLSIQARNPPHRIEKPYANIECCDILTAVGQYLKSFDIPHTLYKYNKKKGNRDIWILRVGGVKPVGKFLRLIRPYSIIKRSQIDIYLNEIEPLLLKHFCNYGKTRSSFKFGKLEFIRLMKLVDRMNKFKSKGVRSKYNSNYFRRIWKYKQKKGQPGYVAS